MTDPVESPPIPGRAGSVAAALDTLPAVNGFRHRGESMTRLETFTDAAFAFAVTLLVISIDEVPTTFGELIAAFKGAPAFAASFMQLMVFWIAHRRWSRRFGLNDGTSTVLSFALVFLILVFVYPLKIIFAGFFSFVSGGWLSSGFRLESYQELAMLFVIYGAGFIGLSLTIVLLNAHALGLREQLYLDDREVFLTRTEIHAWMILGSAGVASILLALTMPNRLLALAGFVYCLLGIVMPMYGRSVGRRFQKIANSPET